MTLRIWLLREGMGHWLGPAWARHSALTPVSFTQVRVAVNIQHACPHPAKTDERQERPGCQAWDVTLYVPPWKEFRLAFLCLPEISGTYFQESTE